MRDAKVVCRQLGLGEPLKAIGGAFFGQGGGPTMLSNVDCIGHETTLGWCLHSGWKGRSCSHSRDANVICKGKGMCATLQTPGESGCHHSAGACVQKWPYICIIQEFHACHYKNIMYRRPCACNIHIKDNYLLQMDMFAYIYIFICRSCSTRLQSNNYRH